MKTHINIGVLGAGISGLATAVNIQNTRMDVKVTIVSDNFLSNTTSSVAAGLWSPYSLGNTPEHLQRHWSTVTIKHLQQLYMTEDCSETGVTSISGYKLSRAEDSSDSFLNPYWKDTVGNFRRLTEDDMKQFPNYHSGIFFTTYLSESLPYMKYLTRRFLDGGGNFVKRKVNNLEELSSSFDVIVNCPGTYARELVDDKECQPIRGQVVVVSAPWLKHFYIEEDGSSYIIPVVDNVVLGGTHQSDIWNTATDETDKKDILEGTRQMIPSLKNAKFICDKVGLRPGRTQVRLEREDMRSGDKVVPVIHNYGHGGAGFTLHWGCSIEASNMVVEAAKDIMGRSML